VDASKNLTWLLAPALCLIGCAFESQNQFSKLYDYYFPKHSPYIESSVYRRSFDERLFGPPPVSGSTRARELYYAFHGESDAFHAFLHNSERNVSGAAGEEWVQECLLLLLRLGDERFSQLLAKEDIHTRDAVGLAIEPQIDWNKHHFPKTRALYSYRYVRP
jgi:hypothetical protein